MNAPTIALTLEAVLAVRSQLSKRRTPASSLRLGVRGGGCSGFSYVVEFHDGNPGPRDHVFQFEDVRVVVDPKSAVYLDGMELHWKRSLLNDGFEFRNPNAKKSCGCGHSFEV